jgi:hypothetical protein
MNLLRRWDKMASVIRGSDNFDSGGVNDYMHVRDERAVGTAGGGSTTGTHHTRVFNTVVANTITGAGLATNQITLPAGTYRINGYACALDSNINKVYLYNITDSAIEFSGASNHTSTLDATTTPAILAGTVIIAATEVFEVRHYFQTGKATNGQGFPSNIAAAGSEVYASLEIFKVA